MYLVLDSKTGQISLVDFTVDAPKAEKYEARWMDIKGNYKNVRLYINDRMGTLGEMLSRYFAMCEENKDEDTLYVTIPVQLKGMERVSNAFASEYAGICSEDETEFWAYILMKHFNELNKDIMKFE